jgi:osmotically-inducible protein OsmY
MIRKFHSAGPALRGRAARVSRGLVAGALALAAASLLSACAPLLVGGAVVGTGLVVTDRRTAGIQLEDQSIALRAESAAKALNTLGRIDATSHNRLVLLTGEVPTEADKAAVEKAVAGVENVRTVVNELAVAPNLSVSQRSSDSLLGAKVKASLVDAKDVAANAYRVIAERGVVYLMGRVTEREATRAVEISRSVPGVVKVVRVLDIITEEELAAMSGGKK